MYYPPKIQSFVVLSYIGGGFRVILNAVIGNGGAGRVAFVFVGGLNTQVLPKSASVRGMRARGRVAACSEEAIERVARCPRGLRGAIEFEARCSRGR